MVKMKKNQNEQHHEDYSHEPSDYKSYGDYNILDPAPGGVMQFPDDDDDELSYFAPTDYADDQDLDE